MLSQKGVVLSNQDNLGLILKKILIVIIRLHRRYVGIFYGTTAIHFEPNYGFQVKKFWDRFVKKEIFFPWERMYVLLMMIMMSWISELPSEFWTSTAPYDTLELKFVFYKLFVNAATRWDFLWSKIISEIANSYQIFNFSLF